MPDLPQRKGLMSPNIFAKTAILYLDIAVKYGKWPVVLLAGSLLLYEAILWNKIYPGVSVANIDLSGYTRSEAQEKLEHFSPNRQVVLNYQDKTYQVSVALTYLPDESSNQAFAYGRNGDLSGVVKKQAELLVGKKANLPLAFSLDGQALDQSLETISTQISVPAVEPSITIQGKKVVLSPGKNGADVDTTNLKERVFANLAFNRFEPIQIPIRPVNTELTTEEEKELEARAQKLIGKSVKLTFEYQTFVYTDSDLVNLISPHPTLAGNLDQQKISDTARDVASSVNRPPQDARFSFEDGRVTEFTPGKVGVRVNTQELASTITQAIENLSSGSDKMATLPLPVETTKPQTETREVNNLGIKEVVGHGESTFRGSISSRVHNITIATKRLSGLIIKPGEEFSFNQALGDVSTLTGYEQAYIIKEGQTILGDGGGVCQVSTTFFRAALNTGLPILERHPHSYRVSYYEQGAGPGIDATVFQPGIDLKIKNDTGNNILIQSKLDIKSSKLEFYFYGTSDGRVPKISSPRTWDITTPPPPLYKEDPTLSAGQIKQTEHQINGAKVSFDYEVTRDSEVLQKRTFYSNYRAWQAIYLMGPGATPPQ